MTMIPTLPTRRKVTDGRPDRVVEATRAPVNVLALPHGPSISELAGVGVRRVSVGASLAGAAYSALVRGAQELLEAGTSEYVRRGGSRPHPFSLF